MKDLSIKLFEWTGERWLISFSKNKGDLTIKEKKIKEYEKLVEKSKQSNIYKTVINYFSDAEIVEISESKNKED